VIGGRWEGLFLGKNAMPVGEIKGRMEDFKISALAKTNSRWHKAQKDRASDKRWKIMKYGEDAVTLSLDDCLAKTRKKPWFPSIPAFLRRRHWQEHERMGWWGVSAKTECDARLGKEPGKCTWKSKGAKITSWGEEFDTWSASYFERFVEPLPDDVVLVAVDYHV
jgi:hypothetical protein